jgi:Flp pilus assembly protein TadG
MKRMTLSALRRWRSDERGVAAVEFALIVPILIVVYLFGFAVAEASSVYRKMSDTTVELANVTSQYTTMSANDVSNVMNASAQIMTPYKTSNLTIVLSEVTNDASGNATVTWSKTYNGTALATGAAVTAPAGFKTPGASYILVQTSYAYTPTLGTGFLGSMTMTDQIFQAPRQSNTIPYTG